MVGTLHLLQARLGDQLDDDSRETLELAQANGARMIELLETCLDAERLEKEDLALQVRAVPVVELLTEKSSVKVCWVLW